MNIEIKMRQIRHKMKMKRIRYKIKRTNLDNKPRLTVYKTGKNIYAQIIDDQNGRTLISVSTLNQDVRNAMTGNIKGYNIEGAKLIGNIIGEKAKSMNIKQVVFDRGGYIYCGRIANLASAARAHLEF